MKHIKKLQFENKKIKRKLYLYFNVNLKFIIFKN